MQRHRFLALALAATGLVAFDSSASAQAAERPRASAPDSAHRMMDPVSRILAQREQLKLTDEQARRLEAIRSKYQEKHQAHLERLRRDREERSAFRASMDSARAEVAGVLTPEQERQVEAMRDEWRKEWRARHGGRHWRRGEHGHRGDHGRHHDDMRKKDREGASTEG